MFTSEIGDGIGYWNVGPCFPQQLPIQGEWYDVEVDAPEDVVDWTRVPVGVPTGFSPVRDGMAVSGALERVGGSDPREVVMRLGLGIITIDVARGVEDLSVGDVIRFETPWLELWPYVL
ncbi:hypothetical protein ACIBSV_18035 [Embleya sp. NPDC050154]|uniref:hypothetical protein n=1 Tax=unclassified Embleya TaxID=2699296 RepID=UPI0037B97524